jgi:hypothetical protein
MEGSKMKRRLKVLAVALMAMVSSLVVAAPANAAAANPCWAGAVCLWKDINFGGAHKTLWGPTQQPLSDFGLKNAVSSFCNNTQWYALLIHDNPWSRNDPYIQLAPYGGCYSYVGDVMNDWTTYIKIKNGPGL